MKQDQPSGYFADYHSVRVTAAELREIEIAWKADMYDSERIERLQEVENIAARASGRPAEHVYGYEGPSHECGFYRPENQWFGSRKRGIYVNVNHPTFKNPHQATETVLHEGRHAYQHHAVKNRGFHPDEQQVKEWKRNLRRPKNALRHGSDAYMRQPIELDAGAFEKGISQNIKPHTLKSNSPIEQFHLRNGLEKYGSLKPQRKM